MLYCATFKRAKDLLRNQPEDKRISYAEIASVDPHDPRLSDIRQGITAIIEGQIGEEGEEGEIYDLVTNFIQRDELYDEEGEDVFPR